MALRWAETADIRPLAELWTHAFPGERTVAERVRSLEEGRPYGGVESAYLLEEEGRMVGAFRALRLTQFLSGSPFPMLGLAAVAVSPTARRRGVGARLCREAIRIGRDRGDVVCALYPFRPDFYRRLGWGLVGELRSHLFRPEWLPDHAHERVRLAAGAHDLSGVASCYARVAAGSNGLIERAPKVWAYHTGAADTYTFVHDDAGVRGYLRVLYGRARAAEKRPLVVQEIVAESDEVYRSLLGWIAAQRDQWRLVRYDARAEERLDLLLRDPRPPESAPARALWFPTGRTIRGPMLRVLDASRALAGRRWPEALPAGAVLEVTVADEEVAENRGPWTVALEGGRADVARRAAGRPSARLSCDAATFAQLLAGELPPTAAARVGLATLDGDAALLDRALRPTEGFRLLDEF